MAQRRGRQQRVEVNASHFVRGFIDATPQVERRAEEFVTGVGEFMARQARHNVPVDQGDLRESMETKTSRTRLSAKTGRGGNFYFEVRFTDDAALPQEFGTSEADAQPFLRPARRQAAQRLNRG
jgi:HK97 gp10 family phage protein